MITHAIQLECQLLFADRLGLSKAVKAEVRTSQDPIAESAIRVQAHGLLSFREPLVKFTKIAVIANREIIARD